MQMLQDGIGCCIARALLAPTYWGLLNAQQQTVDAIHDVCVCVCARPRVRVRVRALTSRGLCAGEAEHHTFEHDTLSSHLYLFGTWCAAGTRVCA